MQPMGNLSTIRERNYAETWLFDLEAPSIGKESIFGTRACTRRLTLQITLSEAK